MTETPIQRVLNAAARGAAAPRQLGDRQWQANCPSHDDGTPSLSIGLGDDDVVLLHCHAGCGIDEILGAFHLARADLFQKSNGNGARGAGAPTKREIVARYPYSDELGEVLYEVVRYHPKDFRQRRPDGGGGWSWKLGDTRRVLYRLPWVLEAVANHKLIWVVEGEKDADRLQEILPDGEVATTNAGGAQKWRPEYTEALRGAGVMIWGDRDVVGAKHVAAVAAALAAVAATVVCVTSPRFKDAAEHLGAGLGLDDLVPVDVDPVQAPRGADDEEDDEEGALPDGWRATDVGNAARLLTHSAGRLRYVHAWGKWIVYQRGRWIIDENDALVTEHAKQVARGLFKVAAGIAGDKDERGRAWNWAIKSEASGAIAAMVRLARGAPGVLVAHEQLDADPFLLNVRNGTIDLRTSALRPHDPDDLMTVQCPVSYDPDARAPLWDACVDRWQPDPEVRTYIQVRAGAAATGKPTETVDVDYGGGGNGKSKFWGAIQHVLGDYTVVPHKSLLVAQRHEQHATVVANLFRKRLAVASETKAADVLDDEQVKNLTGGDRLSGRRMREDPWEFEPTHTLVMFSNHRPTIKGRDEGIWRRLRLVPWEVTIPEDERDDDLADKLKAEAPGILNWIVEGARRFISEGLTPPLAVRAATDDYRADEDTVGRFVGEVLRIGVGWAWSADIRSELEAWCADEGVTPVPDMKDLAEVLRADGCQTERRSISGRRGTIWRGVTLAGIEADTPSDQGKH